MKDYAVLLKESGLKATFQRIQLLENVGKCGHMSVDAIYAEVIKTHPSLSLATVYKNIILMVENGLLTEVPINGKKSKYELSKEDHIHLICTECGDVEDKPYTTGIDISFSTMMKKEKFSFFKAQTNLYGLCIDCQNI